MGRDYPKGSIDFQSGAINIGRMEAGFWVLEGMDGSGKSTQAEILVDWLQEQGRNPLHLREPGSTGLGEGLRRMLLDADREAWDPRSEALLFFAARNELLRSEIGPALRAGRDVVCERFTPSTVAYQGQQEGMADWVLSLDRLVVPMELQPHGVLILDLDAQTSFARTAVEEAPDGFERRGVDFQERVRQGYLAYALAHPDRTQVISVQEKTIAEVSAVMRAAVEERRP